MAAITPLRQPPSAQTAFDESAMREPVEVLFKEARRHARRRRVVVAAAAAAAVATVAAIAVTASIDGEDPRRGQGAVLGVPAATSSFGVFEPLSGRIVYVAGNELSGIDPADPTSVHSIPLPDELEVRPVVSGWSGDGTRLALASEESGEIYRMDAEGRITRAPSAMGCCGFVSDPWLSPDGTTALEFVTTETVHLRDLESGDSSRVIELEPPVGDVSEGILPMHAWSPDGTRIAYAVEQQVGFALVPSIFVVDLPTGITRELVGPWFGHIRHMTWSPDGAQLLVTAGPWRPSTVEPNRNPLTLPLETGLYLVDTDRSDLGPASTPNLIASGHYIAATWSPDGDQIAAIDFATPYVHRLVAMRSDGSAVRLLVDRMVPILFTGLAWHPGPSGR